MILMNIYEIFIFSIRLLYLPFMLCPIQDNKVVVRVGSGHGYGEHAKYIVQRALDENLNWDIVWVVHSYGPVNDLPSAVRQVKEHSFKSFYEFATARVWIDSTRKRSYIQKKKQQYYIQTWHGFGPKTSSEKNLPYFHRRSISHDLKMTDIYLSNNRLLTSYYRDDFGYDGLVLEVGFPRCDLFYSGSRSLVLEKVCSRLNIPKNSKIILYAPTYRQDASLDQYKLNVNRWVEVVSDRFGGEWVFVLRLHPAISHLSSILVKESENIIDASEYLDVQELLYSADILITDYSSCMFDFALTRRLVLLYTPDFEKQNNLRGFLMDLNELPFLKSNTEEGLFLKIRDYDSETYLKNLENTFSKYHMCDNGTASKSVVDWIENKINNP